MNQELDTYLDKEWQKEQECLRMIILSCGLTEELKWGKPCFMFQGKNIVIIQGFKKYCALLFFKGALLSDASGVLVKTGENSRVGRQIRFTNVREIIEMAPVLKACIKEAVEVEKNGLKVESEKPTELKIPEELQNKLDETPVLKTAFEALTPGRQRAYIYYFSASKQSKTRELRIEKYIPKILDGKGLNDQVW